MSDLDKVKTESFALRFSMCGYIFMATLGIGFAWATHSEAIMLDGVYSLLSFGMALLAAKVVRLVLSPGSERFHFGFAHFEPLLNAFRGMMIVSLCGLASLSAIDALLNGGRPLNTGLAIYYGIAACIGCLVLAFIQNRFAHKVDSPTLKVDAKNWLLDGLVSSAVALTFIIANLMLDSEFEAWIPYVDPSLVLILTIVLLPLPLATIRDNVSELLLVAPSLEEQTEVRRHVELAVQDLDAHDLYIRMQRMGRTFNVVVHLVLPKTYPCNNVGELDALREKIFTALKQYQPQLAVDVVVTADANYAAGTL